MEPWMIWSLIIGIPALLLIWLYNRLISVRNKAREAFRAIDVYLEQRFDALTKVAEAVVGYVHHEKDTLTRITEIRNGMSRMPDDEKVRAYNEAENLVQGMRLQVENYPDLKASQNYLHLQKTVNDLEEKLSASRRTYNARVNQYNTMIEQFPTNVFANLMNFSKKEMLVAAESKRQDVDIRSILRS